MSTGRTALVVAAVVSICVIAGLAIALGIIVTQNSDDTDKPCDPGDTRDDVELHGEEIEINDNVPAYVGFPDSDISNDRAILVIHDIFGWELGATRVVVDDLASHGYTAFLPDLFRGNPWDVNAPSFDDFLAWRASHPQDRVDGDIDATLDYIRDEVGIKIVGVIGFCYGGNQVVLSSSGSSIRFQAGFGFYGGGTTPEQTLQMKVPTMLVGGAADSSIPLSEVEAIRNALSDANRLVFNETADDSALYGPAAGYYLFDGMDHGFAHRGDRNDSAINAAAEEAFNKMYAWFEKYLHN